ncbi:manganese transporter, partial [Mycolicibacterium sp. 120322]
TTLFPDLDVVSVTEYLAAGIVVLAAFAVGTLKWLQRRRPTAPAPPPAVDGPEKMRWRMPPLALLEPVTWSAGTKLGMLALRGYLVVGAVLLIVKAVQLGGG